MVSVVAGTQHFPSFDTCRTIRSSLLPLLSQKNMFSSPLLSFALVSALVGTAVSGYSILSPGGSNLWWGERLDFLLSPFNNHFPKSPNPQILLCGLAMTILLPHLSSSCAFSLPF